jgi:nucleotide-binding universal stress UspA family protein
MLAIKTILHPTDFSPQADSAFEVARALARDYGASIILMHVRDMQVAVSGEFGAFAVAPGDDRKALQDRLDQMKRANEPEVVEAFLAEGDPATEIKALAANKKCDLIVMGTHGRTGLARLLMGSVAEYVVRKAHCPVLAVKTSVPLVAETNTAKSPVAVG